MSIIFPQSLFSMKVPATWYCELGADMTIAPGHGHTPGSKTSRKQMMGKCIKNMLKKPYVKYNGILIYDMDGHINNEFNDLIHRFNAPEFLDSLICLGRSGSVQSGHLPVHTERAHRPSDILWKVGTSNCGISALSG